MVQIVCQLPPMVEGLTGIKLLEQVPALSTASGKDGSMNK
jgi:hypothetical protein